MKWETRLGKVEGESIESVPVLSGIIIREYTDIFYSLDVLKEASVTLFDPILLLLSGHTKQKGSTL